MDTGKNYTFRVTMSDTSSPDHGQKEVYNLVVKDKHLSLCDPVSNSVVLEWPYRFVRRFGQSPTMFSIDAGRRSESGEGVFQMQTSEAKQIMARIMEKTVKTLDEESSKVQEKQNRKHKELPPLPPPSKCEVPANQTREYVNTRPRPQPCQQESTYVNESQRDKDKEFVSLQGGKVSIGVDKLRIGADTTCMDKVHLDKLRIGMDEDCIGSGKTSSADKFRVGKDKARDGVDKVTVGKDKIEDGVQVFGVGKVKVRDGVDKVTVGKDKIEDGVQVIGFGKGKVRDGVDKMWTDIDGVDKDPDSGPPAQQQRYVAMTIGNSGNQHGPHSTYCNLPKDNVSDSGDYITPIPPKVWQI